MFHPLHLWITQYGYVAIFGLLSLGFVGVPVPDEALLTLGGALAAQGTLLLLPVLVVAFGGSIVGVTFSYVMGLVCGRWLIDRYGHRLHLDRARIDKAERWFERIGKWALTFGYFIPGVRHLTAFTAGVTRLPFRIMALYAYPGGLVWSWGFILLGYFLGERWRKMTPAAHHAVYLSVAGAAVLVLGSFITIRTLWRRRQQTPPPPAPPA